MFEKVLLPTDFSEYSQKTIECGTELQEIGAKEVVLVHVRELPIEILAEGRFFESLDEIERKIRKEIEEKLDEQARILEDKGIKTKKIVEISQVGVADKIVEIADREKVNLILIGSRGKGWLKKKLLGSVSEEVIINAKVPVLVTKFKMIEKAGKYYCEITFTKLFDKILFACDFSESCNNIVDHVKRIASAGGEVIFVHVVEEFEEKLKKVNEYEQLFEKKTDFIKNKLAGLKVKDVIKFGIPHKEILNVANEDGATLIVIASKGKSGSEFGTTADAIVRRAEMPVLVFK